MKCTYNSLDQMKRLKKENILKVTEVRMNLYIGCS